MPRFSFLKKANACIFTKNIKYTKLKKLENWKLESKKLESKMKIRI
jgi:hypothetical protein